MEGNRLDRFWDFVERLRFLEGDFGILLDRFWDFFRLGFGLGGFWREGEKFFFSTKN